MDICSEHRRDPFLVLFLGQSLVKDLIFAPVLAAIDLGDGLPHSCQDQWEATGPLQASVGVTSPLSLEMLKLTGCPVLSPRE